MTEQELSSVIWDIKEIIRGLYDDAEVEDVILPFTLLRRLFMHKRASRQRLVCHNEIHLCIEKFMKIIDAKIPQKK